MLRDYQIEMKTRLMEAWKAHRSVMVQMPTGTGKTHLLASVVSEFVSSAGSGVWLIAHRRELVAQMEETVNPEHWASRHERGHRFFLRLTAWMVRYLPLPVMRVCTAVVVAYFYLTAPRERRHIRQYQQRLRACYPHAPLPAIAPVYRQFSAFGSAIADRFAVWQHKIRYADLILDDADDIYAEIRKHKQQRGQLFICSHLGNIDVCRALVSHHQGFKLNVLVYSRHAQAFNQALKAAGASDIALIQVNELDAGKMLELAHKLDQGEWIAIAADRIPVRG